MSNLPHDFQVDAASEQTQVSVLPAPKFANITTLKVDLNNCSPFVNLPYTKKLSCINDIRRKGYHLRFPGLEKI